VSPSAHGRRYRAGTHPGGSWGPPLNVVSDAASFLWRAELLGVTAKPELWKEARDYALKAFPKAGVPFADVHTAVACAASGDFPALQKLVGEMNERLAGGKLAPGGVVPMLAEGFGAYARKDWNEAIRLFEKRFPKRCGSAAAARSAISSKGRSPLPTRRREGRTTRASSSRAGRHEHADQEVGGWIDSAQRVVVLTGAGISTDSGIPDFRGPQGVWTRNPKAEKLSDIRYYMTDPEVRRLSWQSRLDHTAWKAQPNAGHRALVALERRGKLHALITQNIDELHQLAGNSPSASSKSTARCARRSA
jgi:hypothetical protein